MFSDKTETGLGLAGVDPNRVSLRTLIELEAPFVLPWCKGSVFFGNGFDSRLALDNKLPWTGRSAFEGLHSARFMSETKCHAATFRESTSSASSASSEHMSASLGVTVGCKFLSANVTGSYDESTSTSKDSTRASRHGAYRAGQLTFEEIPPFAIEAQEALLQGRGEFAKRYGDYFVAGLQLGGEVGVCFTLASDATMHHSKATLAVTVHALFWDATAEHTEETSDSQAHADFTFCGYNTVTQRSEQGHCSRPEERAAVLKAAAPYLSQIDSLRADVNQMLLRFGLQDGRKLSWPRVMEVCASGLVSHVVLMPYSKLPEQVKLDAKARAMRTPLV